MIAEKMIPFVQNNSAIRTMFEEGNRLKKQYGADKVYDFSLGNPSVPAPDCVREAIVDLANNEDPVILHGYMNNAGFEDVRETIFNVQKLLMSVMADIASLNLPEPYIKEEHVKLFEDTIDKFDSLLQPLGHFIIPGDTVGAAALDIARTTTRRAERCLLRLAENEPVNPNVLVCLNRLSDLCFILARVECEVK